MFENSSRSGRDGEPAPAAGSTVTAATVASWVAALTDPASGIAALPDVARVDLIGALETLKCAAAAAQAQVSVALDDSVRARHAALGLPADQHGRGVAAEVALARRESPVRGSQHLGLAKALVQEMPHTLAALSTGRLSEWRATLLARETACLSRQDRGVVDAELAGDASRLEGMGDRRVAAEARRVAYRLDPASALARASKAEKDRRVTLRPAPDTMTWLGALLPVRDGVAVYAALTADADQARADGDPRARGQVMADSLVARVIRPAATTDSAAASGARGPDGAAATTDSAATCDTGEADGTAPTGLRGQDTTVNVVITDRALLGAGAGCDEPAWVRGYGPVAAPLARRWLREEAEVWLRRLYAHPATGELVAMDSKARFFRGGPLPHHPRRSVPHTVVRRDRPPRRPRRPRPGGRSHHRRQRARPLRGLQPRQGQPGLGRDRAGHRPRWRPCGRDHDVHGSALCHPTTPVTRRCNRSGEIRRHR